MVKEGKLPHYRFGVRSNRSVRFKRSEIDEWLKGQKTERVLDNE
jgi:excisionase family DNA binding protein